MTTKVAVTGAKGLLGRHLCATLEAKNVEVIAIDRSIADVTRLDALVEATAGASTIIHCAAFTNVDGAERDEAGAYLANVLGAENAALASRRHGARLVHVSTDFVFDGKKSEGYDEFDAPQPLSIYGRTKWAGEGRVHAIATNAAVVRVQALYGPGGTNFASKLVDLIEGRASLTLDAERRVQPTSAPFAARVIAWLVLSDTTRELPGTFHVSANGSTTWALFGRAIAERLGVEPNWKEVPSSALQAPAARPPVCLFRHRMLELHGFGTVPDWQSVLEEYLAMRGKQ